eukprot:g8630.t1
MDINRQQNGHVRERDEIFNTALRTIARGDYRSKSLRGVKGDSRVLQEEFIHGLFNAKGMIPLSPSKYPTEDTRIEKLRRSSSSKSLKRHIHQILTRVRDQFRSYKLAIAPASSKTHDLETILTFHSYLMDAMEEILALFSLTPYRDVERKANYVWNEYSTLLLKVLEATSNTIGLSDQHNNHSHSRRGPIFMDNQMLKSIERINGQKDELELLLAKTPFDTVNDEDERARRHLRKNIEDQLLALHRLRYTLIKKTKSHTKRRRKVVEKEDAIVILQAFCRRFIATRKVNNIRMKEFIRLTGNYQHNQNIFSGFNWFIQKSYPQDFLLVQKLIHETKQLSRDIA